jgi:hypothetical protein
LTALRCSATLRIVTFRFWDKHPPWAHWALYVVWGIAGTFGPMALGIWVVGGLGPARVLWLGIGLCVVWGVSLTIDWLLVRWLQEHVDGWTPWRPPNWRWLRS